MKMIIYVRMIIYVKAHYLCMNNYLCMKDYLYRNIIYVKGTKSKTNFYDK